MTKTTEVIVIGGGVIGTSIAYYLSRKGRKVILVEKHDLASGASGACDINVFLQSKNPGIHLQMALASAALYRNLAEELTHDIEYRVKGGLILIEDAEELRMMQDFVCRQQKVGLEVQIVDRSEVCQMQPGLADHVVGAAFSPHDAEVNPIELTLGFARAAQKLGAEIIRETEVTGFIQSGGRIEGVETSGGKIFAPLVVNAAGAWSAALAKMVGFDLPVKPRRGQIMITEPLAPYIRKGILSASYILAKYRAASTKPMGIGLSLSQTKKGNILIGGSREFVGYDVTNSYEAMKAILKNALSLVPGLRVFHIIRAMAGLRPYTPDGLPVIGFVDGLEGYFIATGHEGDGIALSPITGRIVADLLTEGKSFLDVSALAPRRFAL